MEKREERRKELMDKFNFCIFNDEFIEFRKIKKEDNTNKVTKKANNVCHLISPFYKFLKEQKKLDKLDGTFFDELSTTFGFI